MRGWGGDHSGSGRGNETEAGTEEDIATLWAETKTMLEDVTCVDTVQDT